ncbi:MAG: hypothetical protein GY765_26815 [bacterium]|nr:hypothetical protein [bacterium]
MGLAVFILSISAILYFLFRSAYKESKFASLLNQPPFRKSSADSDFDFSAHVEGIAGSQESADSDSYVSTLDAMSDVYGSPGISESDYSTMYHRPAGAGTNARTTDTYGGTLYWTFPRKDNYRWIPPSESVEIAGYTIPDGMIYCGKHLNSLSRERQMEPGFIKTDLEVYAANPDRSGGELRYWPSYCNLMPAGRAAYLEWLAGGRIDPRIHRGFVYIFFYGLERRLLHDAENGTVAPAEIRKLLDALTQLGDNYGAKSSSLNERLGRLIEYTSLRFFNESKFYNLEPPPMVDDSQLSISVKLALGQLCKEGKPLPVKWALAYVLHYPEFNLRTPAKRCREEFQTLFAIRYKRLFGDGLVIPPTERNVEMNYYTNFSMRTLELSNLTDIPDVTYSQFLWDKIKSLVIECQNDLGKYSRWLARKGNNKNSIKALNYLPAELVQNIDNREVKDLKQWLTDNITGESENALLNNEALIKRWPVKTPGKMTRKESQAFVVFLQNLGFGIEPDFRFGGPSLKLPGHSVVFKLDESEEVTESASAAYYRIFILLTCAVAVAKSDEVIAREEKKVLLDSIENSRQLVPSEKRRLRHALSWLLQSDTVAQRLKRKIEIFDHSEKDQFADTMIAVAGADGFIRPKEVKMLTKLFAFLGFDAQLVYTGIHRYQTESKREPDQFVSESVGDSPDTGFGVPKPAGAALESGFVLDKGKIAAKIKDTARVSLLLAGVFEEDIPEEPAAMDIVEPRQDSIHGLDTAHSAILNAFQKQAVWPRAEFEALAAQYDLMPDGALETLNEKAFDLFDEGLCENDDPIEINPEILEEFFK